MPVFNNILAGAAGSGGADAGYKITRSLRFNDDDSAYLSRTPSSAGNRKTWTWSGWIKKTADAGSPDDALFTAGTAGATQNRFIIKFSTGDQSLEIGQDNGGTFTLFRKTSQVFRDYSSWGHLVVAFDSTSSTADDRLKIYWNGSQITEFATNNTIAQNLDSFVNNTGAHYICDDVGGYHGNLDAYLAEVHFIDGQALTASDFGEYDDNNVWQPKEFTGTYPDTLSTEMTSISSGNIFPANGTSTLNALDGSTSTALDCRRGTHASTTSIRFTPSTAITGVTKIRVWAPFANKYQINGGGYQTFTGTSGWSEIYNSSSISLTTLDVIRDSGNAGSDYGHQLHAIEINDVILTRDGSNNSFHLDFSDNSSNAALGTDSSGNSNTWTVNNLTAAGLSMNQTQTWSTYGSASSGGALTNLPITNGFNGDTSNQTEGDTTGAYFSIPFSTTIASGDVGFFTYASGDSGHMKLYNGSTEVDDVTSGTGGLWKYSTYAGAITEIRISRDSRAFEFAAVSVFGEVLVDAGVSDPTVKNIDSLIDTPTNYTADSGNNNGGNYATLNPLSTTATLTNGNLDFNAGGSKSAFSTLYVSSGKYYAEFTISTVQSGTQVGIAPTTEVNDGYASSIFYASSGNKVANNWPGTSYGSTYTSGDVIGIALDMDNGTATAYKNNVSQGQLASGLTGSWGFATRADGTSLHIANFGQRPFAYTPPSGYVSLCTTNLPDPTIADGSTVFDVPIWTGDSTSRNITIDGGFSPDLVWVKNRSSNLGRPLLYDAIRGAGANKALASDGRESEGNVGDDSTNGYVSSFLSDGFSVNSQRNVNIASDAYVAWCWDAGSSTVSNTDGTIISSVRASQTNGFSIVKYEGTGANDTVGHGLNAAPDWIIFKDINRNDEPWFVYHSALGSSAYLFLNTTAAETTGQSDFMNSTDPTSSVFSVGNAVGKQNRDGSNFLALCWTAVEGYSAFGSYEGTGNSDGPFVFCGFRPRWIMYKNADATEGWGITDTARSVDNPADEKLEPNTSSAEATVTNRIDVLSNGFKIRAGSAQSPNESGNTYIYAAFAEHPFKTARAR